MLDGRIGTGLSFDTNYTKNKHNCINNIALFALNVNIYNLFFIKYIFVFFYTMN